MRQKRRQQDPWEGYEFIDINSRADEEPPPRQPARQRASRRGRASPSRPPRGQPSRQRREPQRPARASRSRQPQQRRQRKPISKAARRFLLVFTLLCMVAVTAVMCVFLVFKVRTIQVTGDLVYEESAILDVCGYQVGDNLALLTTAEQEDALESQLPYIEEAQVIRHFPNTLEIHVTAAQKAACVQSGSQWFNVSYSGKILESVAAPEDGVLQVTGLTLTDPAPGAQLQAQDEDYQSAYDTIFAVLEQRGAAGDFVSLDLTDLYNITMNYQDRIQFQLGSTVELAYKINYGLDLVTGRENQEYIGSDETGTLDLSLAGDTKQAYFTEEVLSSSSTSESGDTGTDSSGGEDTSTGEDSTQPTGEGTGSTGEDSGSSSGEEGSSQEGGSTSQSNRGNDIPSAIFTG